MWAGMALVLTLAACDKEPQVDPGADGHKVTADSVYDAKETIENEALRFSLALPASNWKLMRGQDARGLGASVVAAAGDPEGRVGVVTVERFSGGSLAEAEALTAKELEGVTNLQTTDVTIGPYAARRSYFRTSGGGEPSDVVRVLFIREGYLYRLQVQGPADASREPALQLFVDAFSPTEGPIDAAALARPAVRDAVGAGWSIEGGVFTSGVSGLRITPPEGWGFIVGPELHANMPEAEVMLEHGPLGCYVAVAVEPMLGRKRAEMFASKWAAIDATWSPSGAPSSSEGVETRRFTRSNMTFDVQLSVHEGVLFQRIVWLDSSRVEQAAGALTALYDRFEFLDRATRDGRLVALEERQKAQPPVQVQVGVNQIGRVVTDFRRRLRLTVPEGVHDVRIGTDAQERAPGTVISVRQLLTGAAMDIAVVEGGASQLETHHASFAGGVDRSVSASVDGVEALRSEGGSEWGGKPVTHQIVSFPRGEDSVHVHLSVPGTGARATKTLRTLLGGLSLPANTPEAGADGDAFVNRLFGYRADPGAGWTEPSFEAPTPDTHQVLWAKDVGVVTVVSLPMGGTLADGAWVSRYVEQAIREQFAKLGGVGEPELGSEMVAGISWRKMAFEKVVVFGAAHNDGLHFIIAERVPPPDLEAFLKGFRWEV